MRNIVGQVPRGGDFFPRDKVINRIYRRLDSGANVYLAAPRRVGKTAIMRHLEDSPRENYEFKYLITESVDNSINYFKQLSESLHHLKSLSEKSLEKIHKFLPKIKSFKIPASGVTVEFDKESQVFDEFKALLSSLDTKGITIVIMIDEFPQTVENILRQQGQGAAEQFLQFNRELRHTANPKIRFILTGSIGLPTIAEKLDATKDINDLNVIEIPPLNQEEAKALTIKLLNSAEVSYNDDAIAHLLDKIEWFIPFYIQLALQELIDAYLETEETVDATMVDKAFAKITEMRNDIYFAHYYSRLKKTFDEHEHPFALAVLKILSQQDKLTIKQIKELANNHSLVNYPIVLRTLSFDGYIFNSQTGNEAIYRFTSPVLRLWWQQYVL